MNLEVNLNTLLNAVIVLMITIGVKGLFKMKSDMNSGIESVKDEVGKIHTRIGKIETWTEGHETLDEERQKNIMSQIAEIQERRKQAQS